MCRVLCCEQSEVTARCSTEEIWSCPFTFQKKQFRRTDLSDIENYKKKVKIFEAEGPIILTQPHGGTFIPSNVLKYYNNIGISMEDTDWQINKLFDGLLNSATVVQALFSRYLIDVNRDPSGESLYPKQNSTELCPTKNFLGQSIYKTGMHPDEDEIKNRLINFHSVYHKAILQQIERIKEKHGIVLLFDCHSIKSYLPYLFDGRLPDLNFGTVAFGNSEVEYSEMSEQLEGVLKRRRELQDLAAIAAVMGYPVLGPP